MAENLDALIQNRGLKIETVDDGRLTPDKSGVTTRVTGTIGTHKFDIDVTLGLHQNTVEFDNDGDRTCYDAYVDLIYQHSEQLVEAAEKCKTFREVAVH